MKETTLDNSIESKRRRRRALKKTIEKIMNAVFFVCGAAAIAAVALITVYMVVSGLPAIREIGLLDFLFGTEWKSTAAEPKFGILPFILTSIWGTLGAIVIGVPVGLLTAVFLSKVASRRVASVVRPAVELLAGIPSVVYGLIGMMVLVPAVMELFHLKNGTCLFAAILVLAIMILPSIISVSETALNAVPPEYEEASLALGATKIETIFKVSIPAAKSGIVAGIVLGIGRAFGEARVARVFPSSEDVRFEADRPLPGFRPGMQVAFYKFANPGFVVRNSTIEGTVRVRSSGVFENCRFNVFWVHVENEFFVEGPIPRDITFRNCTFTTPYDADAKIFHVGTLGKNGLHNCAYKCKNIVLENCTFEKGTIDVEDGNELIIR